MSKLTMEINGTSDKKVLKRNDKRTRNRTPLSCSVCRSRKVKCDKNRPHCNSCIKTGYKHLCHYLAPEWSKKGYDQLSQDKEMAELKEKLKKLEEQLAKYQGNTSNVFNVKLEDHYESFSPHSVSSDASHRNDSNITTCENQISFKKFDNDDILISKRFESLHINPKNNTLSYLGSTHYLSILKGDPYLKILWGHVFKIREKLLEYHEYQRSYSIKRSKKFKSSSLPLLANSDDNKQSCPVLHSETANKGKCPVNHGGQTSNQKNNSKDETLKSANNSSSSLDSVKKDSKPKAKEDNSKGRGRCPVDHKAFSKDRSLSPFSNADSGSSTNFNKHELAKRINDLLPQPFIINKLINLFFRELYPEIPILDETLFKEELKRILGIHDFGEQNKKYNIVLLNSFDVSHIGIMLVILRLGCVNISQDMNIDLRLGLSKEFIKENLEFNLPTDSDYNVSSEKPISSKVIDYNAKNPKCNVDPNLIHHVHELLADFNLSESLTGISNNSNSIMNSNLVHIHFLLFYKWYLSICPENDTIDTLTNVNSSEKKSELLLSQIIQLAFDCGLHRDPDNFPNLTSNLMNKISQRYDFSNPSKLKEPKIIAKEIQQSIQIFKNQWRKTWFFIVDVDINQCLHNGTPRLLRKLGSFSDVKLPYSEQLSSDTQGSSFTANTSTEANYSNNKKAFINTIESLVYNQQFDYCFNNNLGEIIIGKNCKLFYQLDLVLISISELLLDSQIEVKCKKWKLDLVIEILMNLVENKNNENIIDGSIKKLLNNGLLDPLESYALVESGMEIITPDMCKSQSQKERFSKDNGYNLPSLKSIFEVNNTAIVSDEATVGPTTDGGKKLDIPQENITKCLFFKKHLQLQMMLYTLNYILFTAYEPKLQNNSDSDLLMDLTTLYCQKTLKYSTELFKTSLIFFHNLNSNKIFKTQMKIVIIPYCLDACYRAMQFMICLILRHKVGPLLKDLNNVFSKQIGASTHTSDSESDNEVLKNIANKVEFNEMLFKNEVLTLKESYITDLLISRMEIFHNLTRILAVKYKYSLKLSRSTGFFLTLLKPGSKNNRNLSTASNTSYGSFDFNNKTSNCPASHSASMGSITTLFKNIPSLILQVNGEQLSRCPVYQDSIGFQIKLPTLTGQQSSNNPPRIKPPTLPSLQYQPITSKISRKISDIRTTEEKNKQGNGQNTPLLASNQEPPNIQRNNLLESNILPLPTQPTVQENSVDSSGSEDYIPDFEEFLKQVQLTPTTYVEKVPPELQTVSNTPDGMDVVDLNMLISPNSIMQASMNFLMPLEELNEDVIGMMSSKREDSNQSVWELNEELIN